jgi:hypothetical protein
VERMGAVLMGKSLENDVFSRLLSIKSKKIV